jgi:hypothetical protein
MTTKSIRDARETFCKTWRSKPDNEFLAMINSLVSDDDHMKRKEHVKALMNMKPGDKWYDISTDTFLEVVE